ncbi:MAG: glycosyltransferase family 4 protein [Gemmatimonadota bacterium]
MTDLRIGYLVQQFPPEVGAGPGRVLEMSSRWQEAGAEVTVVTGMPNRPQGRIYDGYRNRIWMEERKPEWGNLRVLRSWLYASPLGGFARTLLNNVTFMVTGALSALFRMPRVDVLIASSPPFFPHVAGVLAARLRGFPLVLEVRDLWPDYLVGMGVLHAEGVAAKALFDLERLLLRQADAVVVVTESFARRMGEKGVPPERIHLVPNGVDTALYHPADEPAPFPEMAKAHSGMDGSSPQGSRDSHLVVGYLGNFGAGQGLEYVVEAARMVEQDLAPEASGGEGAGIRFVLAGDGPERERLEAQVRSAGITNMSIHGPIPKSQTRAFYNACDLCLVPLAPVAVFQETIPSKIFEVLACGRPVLGAMGGEGARVVELAQAGWVVAPGDPRALADQVLAFRGLPWEARKDVGATGPGWVAEHYGRPALAARYLEILASLP